jgi:nicotinamide mononucleotide adenylyltransferase
MPETAALYLGHFSPVTLAHHEIISHLAKSYRVYVLPVRFLKNGNEVNTRSFPFPYELRRKMIVSVFGDSVSVLADYCFHSPFKAYLPPVLSRQSWMLRNQIISKVKERRFVSYTGDRAERLMLKVYGLNPLKSERLPISASSVKELLYRDAIGNQKGEWRSFLPEPVVSLIEQNWDVVKGYASLLDETKRVLGMKFPIDGYHK